VTVADEGEPDTRRQHETWFVSCVVLSPWEKRLKEDTAGTRSLDGGWCPACRARVPEVLRWGCRWTRVSTEKQGGGKKPRPASQREA
jgi:hypothetical protein